MFDLGIDSLGIVKLVSDFQQEFNVKLDVTQIQACKTINDLAQLIQQLLDKHQPVAVKPSIPLQIPPPRSKSAIVFFRLIRKLLKWLWAFEVEGLDNLPTEGTFILCPNHESNFDMIFVTSCLPTKNQITLCTFAKQASLGNRNRLIKSRATGSHSSRRHSNTRWCIKNLQARRSPFVLTNRGSPDTGSDQWSLQYLSASCTHTQIFCFSSKTSPTSSNPFWKTNCTATR